MFDFDDCQYNFYMYDIAATLISWLYQPDFKPGVPRKEALSQDIMEGFRSGYQRHMKLPQDQWENLELFLWFRMSFMLIILASLAKRGAGEGGLLANIRETIAAMENVYKASDIFAAIDSMVSTVRQIRSQQSNSNSQKKSGELQISQNADRILLSGRISYDTAPILEDYLASAAEKTAARLILDFGDVTFLSSAGIRVLLKAYKSSDKSLTLINVGSAIEEVLDTVGLSEYIITK